MAPRCMGLIVRKAGTQERAAAGSVRRVPATPLRIMRGRRRCLSPPISTALRRRHTQPCQNPTRIGCCGRAEGGGQRRYQQHRQAERAHEKQQTMEYAVAAPPVAPATTEPLQHCKVADNDGRQPGKAQSQVVKRGDVTQLLHPHDGKQRNTTDRQRMPHGARAEQGRMGGARRNSHPVSSERLRLEHQRTPANTSEQAGSVRATPRGSAAERPGRRTAAAVTGRRWIHAL